MRIVSLVPSTTEIVGALGLAGALVGRTHECDHPAAVLSVPSVTVDLLRKDQPPAVIDAAVSTSLRDAHTIYALNTRQLRELEPDVVLTQRLCSVCAVSADVVEEALCSLPRHSRVIASDPHSLEAVIGELERIAAELGVPDRGRAVAGALRQRLHQVADRVAGLARPRVALIEWPDPLFAPGHWVPEMIEAAGGRSVFGTPNQPSRRASWEELLTAQPDVVVLGFCGYDLHETQSHIGALASQPEWRSVATAARVIAIDGSAFVSRPGPRLVDGVELLAWALHRPQGGIRPLVGQIAELAEAGWVDLAALSPAQSTAGS